jgi:hypothetical protein
VISLGEGAFNYCSSLSNVTIGHRLTIIGVFAFEWCALASVELPNSVTYIGISAFFGCGSLTNVVIPNSVSEIGPGTFVDCFSLMSVYFEGDAPTVASSAFGGSSPTVYYLPGTKGWGPTFSGLPTVCWNPQVQTDDGGFGVQHNQFGFNVRGTSNLVVLVEASTNLASSIWSPLTTNTLSTGSFHFNDPQWTNYPGRFYRLRWP